MQRLTRGSAARSAGWFVDGSLSPQRSRAVAFRSPEGRSPAVAGPRLPLLYPYHVIPRGVFGCFIRFECDASLRWTVPVLDGQMIRRCSVNVSVRGIPFSLHLGVLLCAFSPRRCALHRITAATKAAVGRQSPGVVI